MRAGPAVKYAGHRPLFMLPTPQVAKAISGVGHLAHCAKCPHLGFRKLFRGLSLLFLSAVFYRLFVGC